MKGKKLLTLVVAGAMVSTALLFGGCSKSTTPDTTKTADTTKIDADQTINLVGYDYTSLDSGKVSDAESITAIGNTLEGLYVEGKKDGKIVEIPAGAESYTTNSDKTVYTFKLRKDAKWSDGQPVTAKDYVYSWERLTNPNTGSDYMTILADLGVKNADKISDPDVKADPTTLGVKAVDDYTFEVTLAQANPAFQAALAFNLLAPMRQDIVTKLGDKYGVDYKNMVYNGAFVVSDYQKGSKLVFKKNDSYWDAKNVKLQTAVCNILDEPNTIVKMFENGELDVAGASKDNIKKLEDEAKQKGTFAETTGTTPSTSYYIFNTTNKYLSNAKVRKALSLGYDRQTQINAVWKRYIPAYGLIPPAITVGSKEFRGATPEPLKNSKDDAKKLMQEGLSELGITDASSVHLKLLMGQSSSTTTAQAQFIQNQWEKLGIKIDITYSVDSPTYFKDRSKGNFDVVSGGWGMDYNEPNNFLGTFASTSGNNNGKYSNPKVDSLIKAASTELDDAKRLKDYQDIENTIVNVDAAVSPYLYQDIHSFKYNYVKGFYIPQFGPYFYLKNVYIQGKTK
ncbi:peptide ABC transporter substrate-binding protein [Clostridium sp. 19966]|uniref:peptide ABC transporter substrate-binding protein n=1 Tax=Clostridium sp. 19966 TaxID=2768166 RepID=UPI0028DEA071|nr:peptide ABC transporter substrate-binding protein [Clostridium sp. 19966]MDT8716540.1 peptide ABC transporter substrate-binding protein [Clostridium sp. 19966]